jgi:hypothetical protein
MEVSWILPISASQVARITGVSHWHLVGGSILYWRVALVLLLSSSPSGASTLHPGFWMSKVNALPSSGTSAGSPHSSLLVVLPQSLFLSQNSLLTEPTTQSRFMEPLLSSALPHEFQSPHLGDGATSSIRTFSLCYYLKSTPKQKARSMVHCGCFSSLRDHRPTIVVAWYLITVTSYMLLNFTGVHGNRAFWYSAKIKEKILLLFFHCCHCCCFAL